MCLLYELFGILCPGCGGTRALISLLRLDIYQAIRYNPYAVILLPSMIIIQLIFKKNKKLIKILDYIFIVMTVLFTILRNVGPLVPYLAPTEVL